MFVGSVIVADDMNLLIGGHGLINHTQKLQPLLMPVTLLTEVIDLPAGGVERGKQRSCSVALVVMRHGLVAARFHRQAGQTNIPIN